MTTPLSQTTKLQVVDCSKFYAEAVTPVRAGPFETEQDAKDWADAHSRGSYAWKWRVVKDARHFNAIQWPTYNCTVTDTSTESDPEHHFICLECNK
jgi:hypothetical protein